MKRSYFIIGALLLSLLLCNSALAPLTVTKSRSGKPVFHLPPPTPYRNQRNPVTPPPPPLVIHLPARFAMAGEPLPIRVKVKNHRDGMKLLLHYRLKGEGIYFSLPMEGNPEEGYEATIPRYMVDPRGLEYYIEAIGKGGKVLATSQNEDNPYLVEVKGRGAKLSPLLLGLVILIVLAIPFTFRRKKREVSSTQRIPRSL